MERFSVEMFSTGVIPAKAGTQYRAILALRVDGDITLGSRFRGNDAACVEAFSG